MPRRPFTSQLPKGRVLLGSERNVIVVLLEERRHAVFLILRVESPRWYVFEIDHFPVQLPRNEIAISEPEEPSLLPRHETVRNQFARQIRVLWREKLHFVQRHEISNRPGRQR